MKDLLGNEVVKGDILLELDRGCGSFDKSDYKYHLKLWEKPKSDKGSGFEYNIDGKKHKYWWASVENSIKIDPDLMPDGFIYSFKHGMSEISSKIETGTLIELIENSNWKEHEVKKRRS